MSCIQGCKTDEIAMIMSVRAGTFPLTVFANEGTIIGFDTDETEVSREIDTDGNFYLAGHSWVNRKFSITTYCTPEARAIDDAWRAFGELEFCGTASIITNCCAGGYSFRSFRMLPPEVASIGTDVGTYTFSFEGIVD